MSFAQQVTVHLAPSALDLVERNLDAALPAPPVAVPELADSYLGCPWRQRDTQITELDLQALDVAIPAPGWLRVDLGARFVAEGVLSYGPCVVSDTCRDRLTVRHGRAVVDLEVVSQPGQPFQVVARNSAFTLDAADVDIALSQCGTGGLVSAVQSVPGGKQLLLWLARGYLEDFARRFITRTLAGALGQFGEIDSPHGSAEVTLGPLAVTPWGIDLGADVRVTRRGPAPACLRGPPGPPTARSDAVAPELSGLGTDTAVALRFDLINAAVYEAWWSRGACLTPADFAPLGVSLTADEAGRKFFGFSPGTAFSLQINTTRPPRIEPVPGPGAGVRVHTSGLEVLLEGVQPDGERRSIRYSTDSITTARVALDPFRNALVLRPESAQITRMEVDDRIGPGGTGSDPAAYERWFNEQVLPAYVRLLSGLPLTGAVFGASGYHAVVRQLHTTGDHVVVGSDLFVAPASDDTAPETSLVEAPRGVVSLAAARLLVAAEDSQVPAELLRFQVTVDGTTRPLDVVREIRIGEPGKTATYEVEVAAVDLAGNVDDSPVALALTVDGQAPEVALTGPRVVNRGTGPLSLAWRASDDTSAAEELATRVEVYEIDDPTDLRSRRLIERHELEAGSTSAALALGTAALYRTEVHVRDRAGNESFTYALVRGSSGCGCDTAGDRLPAGPLGLLLGSLALLWRARRRRA